MKHQYGYVIEKRILHAKKGDKIVGGVTLEDGPAHVDVLAYADPKDRAQVGLEIHSGRNRIVRRIFEHLGYDVRGLDRVMYAGLTKKNVQRGTFRLLTEREIRILKYLNSSFKGSLAPSKAASAHNAANANHASAPEKAAPGKHFANTNQRPAKTTYAAEGRPAKAAPASRRPYKAGNTPEGNAGKHPAKSIPPKGRKPAGPPKGRKPYNAKAPRPEKD